MHKHLVTADVFWQHYSSLLSQTLANDPTWEAKFANDKKWSDLVFGVLEKVGGGLGFHSNQIKRNYGRKQIDMCFLSPTGEIEVAIEHENNSKQWYDEWVKLISLIKCTLKVLLTYHDYRNTDFSLDLKLAGAKGIYNATPNKQPDDHWLLVFGPTIQSFRVNRSRGFEVYHFDGVSFDPIPAPWTWP